MSDTVLDKTADRIPCLSPIASTPPSYDELIKMLSSRPDITVVTDYEKYPNIQNAIVRRDTVGKIWVTVRPDHSGFAHEFKSGIMTNVRFEGNSVPMLCRGFASSGEAAAQITYFSKEEHTGFSMPPDAAFRCDLKYNVSLRQFFSSTGYPIESCDYLVLSPSSTAECGWKIPPDWHGQSAFGAAASLM